MNARAVQIRRPLHTKRLFIKLSRLARSSPRAHTRETRLAPSKCDLITFSTMPKKSSWANHPTGRSPEERSQVLWKLAAIGDPCTTTISPNCVQGKGPNHLHGSSFCELHLR